MPVAISTITTASANTACGARRAAGQHLVEFLRQIQHDEAVPGVLHALDRLPGPSEQRRVAGLDDVAQPRATPAPRGAGAPAFNSTGRAQLGLDHDLADPAGVTRGHRLDHADVLRAIDGEIGAAVAARRPTSARRRRRLRHHVDVDEQDVAHTAVTAAALYGAAHHRPRWRSMSSSVAARRQFRATSPIGPAKAAAIRAHLCTKIRGRPAGSARPTKTSFAAISRAAIITAARRPPASAGRTAGRRCRRRGWAARRREREEVEAGEPRRCSSLITRLDEVATSVSMPLISAA